MKKLLIFALILTLALCVAACDKAPEETPTDAPTEEVTTEAATEAPTEPSLGDSHIDQIADKFGYDLLARIPMDPKLTALVDKGIIELMENDYLSAAADALEGL